MSGRDADAPGGPGPAEGPVCKVGGSLLDVGAAAAAAAAVLEACPSPPVLLCGGGRAADRLRARHHRGELTGRRAHWEAVRVLDANVVVLARRLSLRPALVSSLREVEDALAAGRPSLLAPGPTLRRHDPLPHGWEVTSDSIGAWIAGRLEAPRLLLLKARDATSRPDASGAVPAGAAAREGLVDEHLPRLLAGLPLEAWAVNGRRPERVRRHLAGDARAGTRLGVAPA